MKTQKFNTVNDLSNVDSDNKSAQYLEMVRNFANQASEIAKNEVNFFLKMASKEVINYMRKAESADCEYALYANAHAAEKWLEKMVTRNF